MPMNVCTVHRTADGLVISLPAEVDAANAAQVREELLRALNRAPAVLVVEMTGTLFCDVAGIHALLRARRAATAVTSLRVAAGTPSVQRVLQLTLADRLLAIYPSLDAALAGTPASAGDGAAFPARSRDGRRTAAAPAGPAEQLGRSPR